MRMIRWTTARIASLVVLVALTVALFPGLVLAQDAGSSPLPDAWMFWIALAVAVIGGLWAVARDLVNRMAARPAEDGWDTAKRKMDEWSPWVEKVKRWADPDDPSVPPSPTNRAGQG